ncbi:MAG: MerR family transcriptional regulator [Thermotogae bacterium]|nr:MerR family transcriptional regulator [Thermotogota bacterium]
MKYKINELAEISGVTVRTLHHYDSIGLLSPKRNNNNKYREYGTDEVDKLQQILLYKELGFQLQQIKDILNSNSFVRENALKDQLEILIKKRDQMDKMIITVEKTINNLKDKKEISADEKFYGFKKMIIDNNEKRFGKELRNRFGNDLIDESNKKRINMNSYEWNNTEKLEEDILNLLREAVLSGDPGSDTAQKVCELHKEWLCSYWS